MTYLSLKRLSAQAKMCVFATAEPLGSIHAMDLWAIADCAAIPGLPSREALESWVQWQEQHTSSRHVVYTPSGISHDGFNRLLAAIRPHQMRTRIDAITTLVPLKVEQHPVVLSERAQESYDGALGVRGLDGHKARQKASRDAAAIVPSVMELLQVTYAEHSSVLVFSEMFDLLGPLARAMKARGITFLQIDGSVPEDKRRKIIEKHQRGDARVLLITSAAEAGINA
jgi:SNF2 family DNA or RNA helicase